MERKHVHWIFNNYLKYCKYDLLLNSKKSSKSASRLKEDWWRGEKRDHLNQALASVAY